MEKNAKEGTNQDMLNQINGEARLMRGLAYFYLVRGWGDVIIYEDNYAAAENPQIPLYTEESVLKFVIRDFEQAEKLLPEKATTANHPSRFVAKAYLAKALLAQSGWNKSTRDQATLDRVVTLCDEVINCGQYSLLPNYEDLFKVENNACYAVWKKAQTAPEDYHPEVNVSVEFHDGNIVIKLQDNGEGMSEETKKRLFETFYTTKPIGEGTGLGMAITLDIIENRHGGKLTFESSEGQGATFIFTIPAKR